MIVDNKKEIIQEPTQEQVQDAKELKEVVAQEQDGLSINTKSAELISDTLNKLNAIADTIKAALVANVDYGIIPGVSKPSLFKPGAEKIVLMYGLTQRYDLIENLRDRENGIVLYRFKCTLWNSQERQIAEGYGICSSEEKKYAKQNPYDIENTILKMAKKRALVDAAISIGVLSKVFTQDVEDMNIGNQLQAPKLPKFEALGVYTTIYNLFSEFLPSFNNDKSAYKTAVKALIPGILRAAGTVSVIQEFTLKDKQALLDYLNNVNNFENEKTRFKELHKLA